MSTKIFEEKPSATPATGMGDAKAKIEKQARQLAYDTRYQVKKETGDKKIDPKTMERLLMQRLQKSSAIPAVKMRARQMLLGEEFIESSKELAVECVANAMFKVFVEGSTTEPTSIELNYLKELAENPDKKYKVRVTDKKTGNSYVRYATREKITQLRSNPNISSVEMTEYGDPREGERSRGESTAKAKAGKGLDPVGKEDADPDNDGKKNDSNDRYIMKRRKAIGKAIATRKEEFIADGVDSSDRKITGKGVNNYAGGKYSVVKVFPNDTSDKVDRFGQSGSMASMGIMAGYEVDGEILAEKSVSTSQQKFMALVLNAKRGETPASPAVAKAAKGMSEKSAKDFAKTKHKGLPAHVEEEAADCGCDNKKDKKDARGDYAKKEVIKNQIRSALGAKNPIIMTDGYDSTYGRGEMGEPRGTQPVRVDPETWRKSMEQWRKLQPEIFGDKKLPLAKTKTKSSNTKTA